MLCYAIYAVLPLMCDLKNTHCPQVPRAKHLWTRCVFINPPMLSMLCYLCYAIYAMLSLMCDLCNLRYAIFAILSMLCYLCYAIYTMLPLLCARIAGKQRLSTGASREAPVDNACFSAILRCYLCYAILCYLCYAIYAVLSILCLAARNPGLQGLGTLA